MDWGDGNIESVEGYYSYVSHKYQISSPETYSISVSGRVESINTNSVPALDVILEVEQWGNLNTRSVSFSNCSRLESVAPDEIGFFSTVTSAGSLFSNCQSLKTIPDDLFANAANLQSMSNAFASSGITSVSAKMLKGMKSLTSVYSWFQGAKGLKSIPRDFFSNCPNSANITQINYLFSESGLESIPEDLFKDCENVTSFEGTFYGTSITTIPARLFANNKKVSTVYSAFANCEKLRSVPVSLFDENRRITNFAYVGRDGHVGITPLMRIVDGWWEVSLDEGETWQRIIESGGRDGYTVFTEVDTTHEEYILLTLWDGQVLQVPRFMPVTIDLDVPSDKCLIAGGETLSIPSHEKRP